MNLRLRLQTPNGVLLDEPVRSVVAEDLDGWFGIRPGRRDLVAVLPPGVLVFRDDAGEGFVALAGGLVDLRDGVCRVLAREAVVERDLATVADRVDGYLTGRDARGRAQRDVLDDLAREAMRRLVGEAAR